jgi:hypothetical protein
VDVVRVAHEGPLEELLRLVRDPVAAPDVHAEDGNPVKLTHRGNAHDPDLARVSAAPETVVRIELTRLDIVALPAVLLRRVGRGRFKDLLLGVLREDRPGKNQPRPGLAVIPGSSENPFG